MPNLGRINARDYTTILHRFIDHWERVNAELPTPLTLGPFTLADLQAAHDSLLTLHQEGESLEEGELPLLRARREQLFGDVSDEEREETSIVARLMLYHAVIEATFAGQPLADSLPEIFPGSGSTPSLPTFRFNWAETGASEIELWFEMIDGLTGTDTLYIREGTEEFFTAASPMPGEVFKTPWSGVIIVDEVDEVVLRNGHGIDIARGVRDQTLPDPGP